MIEPDYRTDFNNVYVFHRGTKISIADHKAPRTREVAICWGNNDIDIVAYVYDTVESLIECLEEAKRRIDGYDEHF